MHNAFWSASCTRRIKNIEWLIAGYLTVTPQYCQVPSNQPLYILYSSGTTGAPKCIVHSTIGILLEHFKELSFEIDIRRKDIFFYNTTCGWMMWNWLVSA